MCIAAGIPEAVYLRATPAEQHALHEAIQRRELAAQLRTGMVVAAIYNGRLKKGARAFTARDFVREPPKVLTRAEMEAAFDAWGRVN